MSRSLGRLDIPPPVRRVLRWGRQRFLPRLPESMARDAAVKRAFHHPRPNNFAHVFIPKGRNADEVFDALHEDAGPLNEADRCLMESLGELVSRDPRLPSLELLVHLQTWRDLRSESRFPAVVVELEGIRDAIQAHTELSWVQLLMEQVPEELARFCSLPMRFVRTPRLSLFLSARQIAGLFPLLARRLPEFAPAVRQVDVNVIPTFERQLRPHPTLVLYTEDSTPREVEERLRRFLIEETRPLRLPRPQMEYAEPIAGGIAFSEGYRLYKRYLSILGLLEQVYDEGTGFVRARR